MKLLPIINQIIFESLQDKEKNVHLSDDELNFVYSPEFLQWSNNWKNTIKDDYGFPMKFYRGISKWNDETINYDKIGSWFTPTKEYAMGYAKDLDTDDEIEDNLVTVFLKGSKIINIDDYYDNTYNQIYVDTYRMKNRLKDFDDLVNDKEKFRKDINTSNIIIAKETDKVTSYYVKNKNNIMIYRK